MGSFNGPSPVCFLAQDVRSGNEGFVVPDEKMLTKAASTLYAKPRVGVWKDTRAMHGPSALQLDNKREDDEG